MVHDVGNHGLGHVAHGQFVAGEAQLAQDQLEPQLGDLVDDDEVQLGIGIIGSWRLPLTSHPARVDLT
jgi:hypothetical protein